MLADPRACRRRRRRRPVTTVTISASSSTSVVEQPPPRRPAADRTSQDRRQRAMAIQSPLADRSALRDAVAHRLGDLAGPDPGHRLGHRGLVGGERRGGVVGDQRAERLDHRGGGHHRDRHVGEAGDLLGHRARCSCCWAARSRRRRRTHRPPRGSAPSTGSSTGRPRRPAGRRGRAAGRAVPSPTADRHDRGGDPSSGPRRRGRGRRTRLAHPLAPSDLLDEIGDPDLVGPTRLDARLDRRPDVVGVHVAVPEPSPPTTTIESPSAPHAALNPSMCSSSACEQVHDLVAQVGDVGALVGVGLDRDRACAPPRGGGRAARPPR